MKKFNKKDITLDEKEFKKARKEGLVDLDEITEAILMRRTNPKIKSVESTEEAIKRGVSIEKLPTLKNVPKLNPVKSEYGYNQWFYTLRRKDL